MSADEIIAAIRNAVGNPHAGAVAEALPLIEDAVRQTLSADPAPPSSAKGKADTRVLEAEETRDA